MDLNYVFTLLLTLFDGWYTGYACAMCMYMYYMMTKELQMLWVTLSTLTLHHNRLFFFLHSFCHFLIHIAAVLCELCISCILYGMYGVYGACVRVWCQSRKASENNVVRSWRWYFLTYKIIKFSSLFSFHSFIHSFNSCVLLLRLYVWIIWYNADEDRRHKKVEKWWKW